MQQTCPYLLVAEDSSSFLLFPRHIPQDQSEQDRRPPLADPQCLDDLSLDACVGTDSLLGGVGFDVGEVGD